MILLLWLVGLLLAVTVSMLAFERQLIFFPDRSLPLTPAALGMRFEDVALRTEDGVVLRAWHLPLERARFTFLVCNGNAGNMAYRLERARLVQARLGAAVLLFDYRGHGRSEGRPDEAGSYRDARAAYQFPVEAKGLAPDSIVLFGESLGAAIATELALEKPAAALVLESPFTSIPDMARAAYPFLPPVGPLIRTRYDTLAKVPRLR